MSPPLPLGHPTHSQMARDKGRLLDSSQRESIAKKCVTLCFPLLFIILWLHVTELHPNFIQMGMNYRIHWGLTEPKTHREGLAERGGIRKWNTSTLSSVFHLCSSLYVWFTFLSLFLCFSDLWGRVTWLLKMLWYNFDLSSRERLNMLFQRKETLGEDGIIYSVLISLDGTMPPWFM